MNKSYFSKYHIPLSFLYFGVEDDYKLIERSDMNHATLCTDNFIEVEANAWYVRTILLRLIVRQPEWIQYCQDWRLSENNTSRKRCYIKTTTSGLRRLISRLIFQFKYLKFLKILL